MGVEKTPVEPMAVWGVLLKAPEVCAAGSVLLVGGRSRSELGGA